MSPIEGVRMRFDHVSIAVNSIDRGVGFFRRYFPTVARNDKQVSEQAQADSCGRISTLAARRWS